MKYNNLYVFHATLNFISLWNMIFRTSTKNLRYSLARCEAHLRLLEEIKDLTRNSVKLR